MFKVPFFNTSNYRSIMSKKYYKIDTSDRVNIGQIIFFIQKNIDKYANIDPRDLQWTIDPNLISAKLLIPTLWNCNYFSWKVWDWEHFGIDIILPHKTPIVSFQSGVVHKIKTRDWNKKDWWNTITIKWSEYFWSYLHCDDISVEIWQYINAWDTIWTVGKTWNATQYHIHLQCDLFSAPFVPYISSDMANLSKYTVDPLPIISKIIANSSIFLDMPTQKKYYDAVIKLHNLWIIHWKNNMINPENFIQRYEFAIIINRLITKKPEIIKKISENNEVSINYIDIIEYGQELFDALLLLKKYKIMMWFDNKFLPERKIKWQELLAVCWRLFFGISDSASWIWYEPYLKFFEQKWIIKTDWEFVWEPIPRKEAFHILSSIL